MATPKILTLTPDFLYWKEQHRQREQRRIEALKRGEVAEYGYWKDKPAQIVLNEPLNDDVPAQEYINLYRLEVTRKQANDLIAEGGDNQYGNPVNKQLQTDLQKRIEATLITTSSGTLTADCACSETNTFTKYSKIKKGNINLSPFFLSQNAYGICTP